MTPLPVRQSEVETIYGRTLHGDDSIVVRCTCPSGCILAFNRWDDEDDPEFFGEFYSGFQPATWRHRLKAAWTCLRGREHITNGIVLTREAAMEMGRFLRAERGR